MGDGQIVGDIVFTTPDGEVIGFDRCIKDIQEIAPVENEDAPAELWLPPSDSTVSLTGTMTEYSREVLLWKLFGKYPEHIQVVMNGKPSRKLKWCKSYKKCFNVMMHRGKTRTAGKNFRRLARMYRQADRRWGGRPVPPEWKEKEYADR